MKDSVNLPMFYSTTPEIFRRAARLRATMTETEKIIWQHVRQNQIEDLHFRRQHPMGFYIADFYCHPVKLVVEIDGGIHKRFDRIQKDDWRDRTMEEWGVTVMRFTDTMVTTDTDMVISRIKEKVVALRVIE